MRYLLRSCDGLRWPSGRTLRRTRSAIWLLAFVTMSFATAGLASGQVATATIQGTVSDATGVLPGATITVQDIDSGFTHETVTTADGQFALRQTEYGIKPVSVAGGTIKVKDELKFSFHIVAER